MTKKSVFIAATGQNVGKTTLCLGIISGLKKRFSSIGFIKPVGQQHVKISNDTIVDKDAVLFKEYFKLKTDYSLMSPVILPSGFTRKFLDEEITEQEIKQKIKHAYKNIYDEHDYTIVEGTGHVGVGSIINMNNARIAAELGVEMIIISQGGLGSAFDELALNVAMCRQYGVPIRGVILNRVLDDKKEMIQNYFPKTLKQWGVPLIGCVPFNDFLNTPCMRDFEILFETSLISGEKHRYRHFTNTRLVAGSLETYQEEDLPQSLIITPASRKDIILATIKRHNQHPDSRDGMILTSGFPPDNETLAAIKNSDLPTLYSPTCSYDAMKIITSFTAKTRIEDIPKVEEAIKIVEENIDFDLLCRPVQRASFDAKGPAFIQDMLS